MSHWWRAYDEAVDDPKLQQLRPDLFRGWFNVCCITSQNGGTLPALAAIAFKLRLSEAKTEKLLDELRGAGLIDMSGNGDAAPHNWKGRQFQSDVSTARVKRFRERFKTQHSNVSETSDGTHQIQKQIQKEERKKEPSQETNSLSRAGGPRRPQIVDGGRP